MGIDWPRLRHIIDAHDSFLITSHVRPDGDAIGSELGMAEILAQKGKRHQIVNASSLPPRYRFLDPRGRIAKLGDSIEIEAMQAFEVVIILDTSAWVQLGSMADFVRQTAAKKIVIDHHIGEDDMGAELFKDTKAAACGVIVAESVEHLGCTLTAELAEPLFVAISTDTGWFRFGSTDGRTFRIAAALRDAGVSVDLLYRKIFEESSLARLKLIARMLQSIEQICDRRVAYGKIQLRDLDETGAYPQDSEDLVNYTLSMAGVEVGLLFVELAEGEVKVSFRSRDRFDCTQIASRFGGGGHRQAAGATLKGPLGQVQEQVLAAVRACL